MQQQQQHHYITVTQTSNYWTGSVGGTTVHGSAWGGTSGGSVVLPGAQDLTCIMVQRLMRMEMLEKTFVYNINIAPQATTINVGNMSICCNCKK